MGQVEGKVAIVTGGASGIGAACAATLAREAVRVGRAQRADRPERGRQSRGAARQGWTASRHREWRAIPRLRRFSLHDGAELCDRRWDDGRRKASVELRLTGRGLAEQHSQRVSLAGSPIVIYL